MGESIHVLGGTLALLLGSCYANLTILLYDCAEVDCPKSPFAVVLTLRCSAPLRFSVDAPVKDVDFQGRHSDRSFDWTMDSECPVRKRLMTSQ